MVPRVTPLHTYMMVIRFTLIHTTSPLLQVSHTIHNSGMGTASTLLSAASMVLLKVLSNAARISLASLSCGWKYS